MGFSDVHRKAKSSLTVTFVRYQSGSSHTDVPTFLFFYFSTAGLLKTPLPLNLSLREIRQILFTQTTQLATFKLK